MKSNSTYIIDPYGMTMSGRHGQATDGYRYGFNGMEADDEIKNGDKNSYDFGARMYDPRVGRWLSRDRLEVKYAGVSPYVYSINSPILLKDPYGEVVVLYNSEGKKVATISKSGMVIEKGMENSGILHAYVDTKFYLKDHLETDVFAEFENSGKTLEIRETYDAEGGANFKQPKLAGIRYNDENKNGKLDVKTEDIIEIIQNDPNSLGSIEWDPTKGAVDAEGNSHSPALIFIHELFHGKHWKNNPKQMLKDKSTTDPVYTNMEEKKTIEESNEVSKSLSIPTKAGDFTKPGKSDGGNGGRKSHGGKGFFRAKSTTSNEDAMPTYVEPAVSTGIKNGNSNGLD